MNHRGALLFNFSLAAGKMIEEGIMLDILLRLPVRSLIQFKCVCKSWRDLISDPCFERTHFSRYMLGNPNSQRLLLEYADFDSGPKFVSYKKPDFESIQTGKCLECPVKFKLPKPFTGVCKIVGSCHGLVCLDKYDPGDTFTNRALVVWNPTTSAFKEIPLHPTLTANNHFYVLGFGYDPASDDYKILASYVVSEREVEAIIFAMKEKYWRSVCILQLKNPPFSVVGVYGNGCLHWLQNSFEQIISFDFSNEKFGMIPPPTGIVNNSFFQLEELRGYLILYSSRDYSYNCSKCWIMEDHGSWTKLCDFTGQSGNGKTTGRAMCSRTDGKILLHTVDRENHIQSDFFYLYSLENNQEIEITHPMLRGAQLYMESLVSP